MTRQHLSRAGSHEHHEPFDPENVMQIDGDSRQADEPDWRGEIAAIGVLDRHFERAGIEYWLFGGWAVDFHVGRVTRPHSDIDLAVWGEDAEEVGRLLGADSWEHHPEPGEDGYTAYRKGSLRLDLAFLARDSDGVVYTPLQVGRGDWSPGAFGRDVIQLEGVRACVVSRTSLIADKAEDRDDPVAAAKDRADLTALGLP
jgi:Aminoglycoside-2''-adenylyltransferase